MIDDSDTGLKQIPTSPNIANMDYQNFIQKIVHRKICR